MQEIEVKEKIMKRKVMGFIHGMPNKLKDYWRTLYDSPKRHMTVGSYYITKIITCAHGDNWRRRSECDRSRKLHHHKKK
jgi:hypothetical protein